MATPIVKALKTSYTNIDVLTDCPEVFKQNPYVRHIYTSKDNLFFDHYDQVVNLEQIALMNPKMHQVDAYSFFALHTLLSPEQKRLELYPSAEDVQKVEYLLQHFPPKFICIHMRKKSIPNSAVNNRNLSDKFWISLLTELNKYNLPIIQVGTSSDFHIPPQYNIYSLIDKLTIHQLQLFIAKSALFICVDTSTLHIAGTTQTPIIALFNIVYPELRAPSMANFHPILPDIDCVGCFSYSKPPVHNMDCCIRRDNKCLEMFSIEKILNKVNQLLS